MFRNRVLFPVIRPAYLLRPANRGGLPVMAPGVGGPGTTIPIGAIEFGVRIYLNNQNNPPERGPT